MSPSIFGSGKLRLRQTSAQASKLAALLPFSKYHGIRNDFIMIDARELAIDPELSTLLARWWDIAPALAARLCDRHAGIGADGLILAIPAEFAGAVSINRSLPTSSTQEKSESPTESIEFIESAETAETLEILESSEQNIKTPSISDRKGEHCGEPAKSSFRPLLRTSYEYPRRHDSELTATADNYQEIREKLTANYIDRDAADCAWIFINSDGSQTTMCGNGLRCLALWSYNHLPGKPTEIAIATGDRLVRSLLSRGPATVSPATISPATISKYHCDAYSIEVDMGEPLLEPEKIPCTAQGTNAVFPLSIEWLDGKSLELDAIAVGMGNPHCVIFIEPANFPVKFEYGDSGLAELARRIQNNTIFPRGVNVEFVERISENRARCVVYERGCGFTAACASGACAVLVAGVLTGKLARTANIDLPGGTLEVHWGSDDNRIRLIGPAQEVFSGVFRLPEISDDDPAMQSVMEANCH